MKNDTYFTETLTKYLFKVSVFLILVFNLNIMFADNKGTNSSEKTNTSGTGTASKYQFATNLRNQTVLNIPNRLAQGKLSKFTITNPHWDRKQCSTCHNGQASKANPKLHINDVNSLCQVCHKHIPENLINHPVNIKPTQAMIKRMPIEYKKTLKTKLARKGTMSCLTCHDVIMQCTLSKFVYRTRNSEFFRQGPFRGRTELCFKCHDKSKFKRFNPHKQISKNGTLRKNTCYVCHKEVDKLLNLKSADNLKFNVSDYSKMCTGCHVWVPHPGGDLFTFSFSRKKKEESNHLVKASDMVLIQMKRKLPEQKFYLPLEPKTGKVHCGTCHNVHQKGVIKNKIKAKGADSTNKLRKKRMCDLCHPI